MTLSSALLRCAAVAAAPLLVEGGAPKEDVEVVVAHYDEDLSWMSQYDRPGVKFSVYSKGARPHPGSVLLPNVGRESHTYLNHIVNNYDQLPKWTVFTQGSAPSWGYISGDRQSGHLTDELSFEDYLEPKNRSSMFIISAASHLPQGLQSTRVGIITNKLKRMSNDVCPADAADGWTSWWFDPQHPHAKDGQKMMDFYFDKIVQKAADARQLTLGFVQGARLGLSRERIHLRPLSYYKALLETLSAERDPLEGYFMEAMWYDVFHPDRVQAAEQLCALPTLPADGKGMPLEAMFEETARRLNDGGFLWEPIQPRALSGAYNPTTTAAPVSAAAGVHLAAPALLALLAAWSLA